MRFIIEHSNTKREIKGSFRICASKEDLLFLSEQLAKEAKDFSYGWIEIHEPLPQMTEANTKPRHWDE